ncbi:hypothetical protein [Methanofollis ethanolicus]|uniref:hypothetical protein n=1 Tax=Methanofollis ethanolicus TaxID=488124 RepID=UPI00082D3999|nr:hypothetical protein [Methanofollis ethanolicus]
MPFVTRARNFMFDQGVLCSSRYCTLMVETVRFLLDHAVGLEHAVPTAEILAHLLAEGYEISHEEWKKEILEPLDHAGVFFGVTSSDRMFLIAAPDDAQATLTYYQSRIQEQTQRMAVLKRLLDEAGWSKKIPYN